MLGAFNGSEEAPEAWKKVASCKRAARGTWIEFLRFQRALEVREDSPNISLIIFDTVQSEHFKILILKTLLGMMLSLIEHIFPDSFDL
jgi:hypothetical protein